MIDKFDRQFVKNLLYVSTDGYLQQNAQKNTGDHLLYIQYCFSSEKRRLLPTLISVPKIYWSKKDQSISNRLPALFGNYQEMNKIILRQKRLVEDLINKANEERVIPFDFVIKHYKPQLTLDEVGEFRNDAIRLNQIKVKNEFYNQTVFGQIDAYILSKQKKVSPDMIRIYNNMKSQLQCFEVFRGEQITFEQMNLSFYEKFVEYLTYYHQQRQRKSIIGLKLNSIGKTIKELRGFL